MAYHGACSNPGTSLGGAENKGFGASSQTLFTYRDLVPFAAQARLSNVTIRKTRGIEDKIWTKQRFPCKLGLLS